MSYITYIKQLIVFTIKFLYKNIFSNIKISKVPSSTMVANDIKIILKMNNKSEMSLEKTYYNNIISLLSFTKTKISQAVIKTHMT